MLDINALVLSYLLLKAEANTVNFVVSIS
jgi:hypothetical protein